MRRNSTDKGRTPEREKTWARPLDRLTEKALKRSSLAQDRREQLNKAYKQHQERDRGLGFDL